MTQSICTAGIFLSNQEKCPFSFPFYFNIRVPLDWAKATYQQVSFFLCCIRQQYNLMQILQEVTLVFQELCGCERPRCLNGPFCQQVILLRLPLHTFKISQPFPLPVSWFMFLNPLWIAPNPWTQPFLPFSWTAPVSEGRQLFLGWDKLKEICHYNIFYKQTSDPCAS